MAGPGASFDGDGDGDAVMFDDNNDDFQLPDNFDNVVNVAADGVLSLSTCTTQTKTGKEERFRKGSLVHQFQLCD